MKHALRRFSMKKIAFVWRAAWLALAAFAGGRSVLGADPVFDCQFNDSSCLSSWSQHYGSWTVAGGHLSTPGLPGYSSSISYSADFSGTLDYTVVMRRFGENTAASRIYIRGVPEPLVGDDQGWYSGYLFQYTRAGEVSVFRALNNTTTALRSWTSHSAVHAGDSWNTLRVAAEGGDLHYYVNGTLVWSGTDSTFSTGRVGIGMYTPSGGSGDSLEVDSAVLYGEVLPSPVSEPTPPARVDTGDYDGDGTSDIAIFRGSSGMWSARNLTRFYFGASTDDLVPGDYNGAGRWEAGIFRPTSGLWSIRGVTRIYLGSAGDSALPADYNGDAIDEAAIFRDSAGMWSVRNLTRVYFGGTGDVPVTR